MYNVQGESQIRLISSYNIWASIMGGISWLLSDSFAASIIGGLFGGWLIITLENLRDQYLLTLFDNINLKSDRIKRCLGLLLLAEQCKNPKHEWLFALYGFVIYHRLGCPIMMCPITQLVNNRDKKGKYDLHETVTYIQFAVLRQLKSAITALPNDLDYYWFTIGYLLENTKNYLLSLELITCVSQNEMGAFQRFFLSCYWYLIKTLFE